MINQSEHRKQYVTFIVNESEDIPTKSTSDLEFIHDIEAALAKAYQSHLSNEIKRGMKEKAEYGIWPTVAPLGYINKDKTIVLDPGTAPLIKHAFKMAATGKHSPSSISDALWAKGLRSKNSGKKVSPKSISTTLKNSLYYGIFLWNGSKYNGKHEPIISKALFDKAQKGLAKNTYLSKS